MERIPIINISSIQPLLKTPYKLPIINRKLNRSSFLNESSMRRAVKVSQIPKRLPQRKCHHKSEEQLEDNPLIWATGQDIINEYKQSVKSLEPNKIIQILRKTEKKTYVQKKDRNKEYIRYKRGSFFKAEANFSGVLKKKLEYSRRCSYSLHSNISQNSIN